MVKTTNEYSLFIMQIIIGTLFSILFGSVITGMIATSINRYFILVGIFSLIFMVISFGLSIYDFSNKRIIIYIKKRK